MIGILIAGFKLDGFSSFMEEVDLYGDSSVSIVDHRGVRLYRYPRDDVLGPGTALPDDVIQRISGDSLQGLLERTGQDGVDRIYAFRQLRLREGASPYMYVMVGLSKSGILQRANQQMAHCLALLGVICLISIALAWLFGFYVIVKPINQLASTVRQLGAGRLGSRTGLRHTSDEMGRLARSFDDMVALLEQKNRERERAEESLRQAEEKYRGIFENAVSGIFQSTGDGRLIEVNQALARILGYASPEELIRLVDDFRHQVFADRSKYEACQQIVLDHGEGLFDLEIRMKDGGMGWVSVHVRAVQGEREELSRFEGVVEDITERKRAEQTVREREAALCQAHAFNRSIIENISEGLCVWHSILQLPLTRFTVWNERMTEITGYTMADVNRQGWAVLLPDAQARSNAAERLMRLCEGKERFAEEWAITRADGRQRIVDVSSAVVESHEGMIHLLALMRDITEQKAAREELVDYRDHLEVLVKERTGELEAAVEQLHQEVGERKRVEETLRESEAKLRSFIETTSDWVWEVDANGRFTYVSDKVRDFLGYEPHEVEGKTPWDLMPAEDVRSAIDSFHLLTASPRSFVNFENTNVHKDGRSILLETSGALLLDSEGAFAGYRGINRDITERKRIEKQLRESEARYRTLVEQIPAITYIATIGQRLSTVYVSPQVETMLGFTQEEAIADRSLRSRVLHPDDRDRVLSLLRRIKHDGGPFSTEYRVIDRNGVVKWFRDEARVVRSPCGEPIFLHGIMLDISEGKRMEEALRYSENLYRTVFETTGTAMILVEEDTTISLVNAQYEKDLGYSKQEVEGKRSWTLSVPQKDLERFKGYHALRRVNPDMAPKQYEAQIIDRRGRYRDFLVTVGMIPGTAKSVASLLDITARRDMERALEQSVAELHNLQCITRKLLEREDLSSVMHSIAEGIVVNLGFDMALAARYVVQEHALTGIVLYPEQLQDIMDRYLPGNPQKPLWERKLKFSEREDSPRVGVLKGETMMGDTLAPFLSDWVSPSDAHKMQELTGRVGYISVPMQVKGETVGIILAGWNDNDIDLTRMRNALLRVADQAAVALKSAGLLECTRSQRSELRALTAKLQQVQEAERKRLAQELHDRVGQNLTGLSINLGILRSRFCPDCLERVRSRIADSLALVGKTMACIRDVMAELHPPGLSEYGLSAALKCYCDELSRRSGCRVSMTLMDTGRLMPRECDIALFRIAQEALTNAVKHSRALEIRVSLTFSEGRLVLCIADDGVGIDLDTQTRLAEGGRFGMISMRERAEAAGAEFRVESAPGRGTKVIVELEEVTS